MFVYFSQGRHDRVLCVNILQTNSTLGTYLILSERSNSREILRLDDLSRREARLLCFINPKHNIKLGGRAKWMTRFVGEKLWPNVMGFQQIRRPNFDRHGAWFTMGNPEPHLIKGTPIVHSGDDLIVGHLSIETYGIDKVPGLLRKMGVPFRQNVSVSKGGTAAGEGTNSSSSSKKIVRQYFFRDPDGYYLEVCNCGKDSDERAIMRESPCSNDLQRTRIAPLQTRVAIILRVVWNVFRFRFGNHTVVDEAMSRYCPLIQ